MALFHSFLWLNNISSHGLSWWLRWLRICPRCRRLWFGPWVGNIPWRREWLPTVVFLPGECHGQRRLVGYGPWGHRVRHDWETKHECTHAYSLVYMHQVFFIHLLVSGHLGCFGVMDITNSTAMNIEVYVSFWIMVFSRYRPRREIAGSYGSSLFTYLLIYFWLYWVFTAAGAFSSCGEQGLHSSCGTWASHCLGFSCRGAHTPGHAEFLRRGVWTW